MNHVLIVRFDGEIGAPLGRPRRGEWRVLVRPQRRDVLRATLDPACQLVVIHLAGEEWAPEVVALASLLHASRSAVPLLVTTTPALRSWEKELRSCGVTAFCVAKGKDWIQKLPSTPVTSRWAGELAALDA